MTKYNLHVTLKIGLFPNRYSILSIAGQFLPLSIALPIKHTSGDITPPQSILGLTQLKLSSSPPERINAAI